MSDVAFSPTITRPSTSMYNYLPFLYHPAKLFFFFDWENNFILFGTVGRGPVLELLELHLGAGSLGDLHIEAFCLAQGPALTHCVNVTDLDVPEVGGKVHGHVLVVLPEVVVLSDVVEVVSADDSGPLHLQLGHQARQDPPSDGEITSKRAFLVNVSALNGLLWCLEAQTDVLVVLRELLLDSFTKQDPLLILKDDQLLSVDTLSLNVRHLPSCLKKGSAKYFCPQFADEESETWHLSVGM